MREENDLLQCELKTCRYPSYKNINQRFLCWLHYLKEIQKGRKKK